MKISRVFAFASKDTFTIKPIAELIKRYADDGWKWVDPFAGYNSPAMITNDLNPDVPASFHLHALEFAHILQDNTYEGVLFDPPYSLRQVNECYKAIGASDFMKKDSLYFPRNVMRAIAPKIRVGGYAITFGWDSNGFGSNLGFELKEVLLVAHGGKHHDTIVTVEQKVTEQLFPECKDNY